jgi:hypothetical protein
MVERPFTPLHGVAEDGTIQLWVKRYEGGEVGRWLHARQPGEVLDIRGPMETLRWPYPPGKQWDHVVLVSSWSHTVRVSNQRVDFWRNGICAFLPTIVSVTAFVD